MLNHSNVIAPESGNPNILQMATQVAKVDSTVLVTGESGVGKEVIANTIHRLSPRSEGPLIKINCGSSLRICWRRNCSDMNGSFYRSP